MADFSMQTAEPLTPDERRAWVERRVDDMRARGATWWRVSFHDGDLMLLEGWETRPFPEPEPEPAFAAADGEGDRDG